MITIVLPAEMIPDGTQVRKEKGEVLYVLKKRIEVFMPKQEDRKVFFTDDFMFLVGDSISGISIRTKLAIDFQSIDDSINFLEDLIGRGE